jgi:outer membrane protein assembly factor BamB
VFGENVYLATEDDSRNAQLVVCFDRRTGDPNWEAVVHQGGYENQGKRKANEKASWASSTVATDGERLFINFFNDSAIYTSALDLTGKVLWRQRLSDYEIHQGYGSSPAIYEHLVISSADNKTGGAVVAMDRRTGDVVWRRDRPAKPNYASPVILHADNKDQLIFTGCDLVTSLDPLTGETDWEIEGATTECVTTSVTDATHVFTSGGYPKNHVSAVVADGSGRIAWEINTRAYVPSILHHEGFLYLTLDAGIATCLDAKTGETLWKQRLGGVFSSSPVLVGDVIYATNEQGETFVFKADPERFEMVGQNKLGESVFATPAICGGRIYTRVALDESGKRQEYLYCLGEKE